MKDSFLKLTIVGMVILFFFGCSQHIKPPETLDQDRGEAAISVEHESPYYYYTEAQIQQKKGNLDTAIDYLNKAIQEDPESSYLQLELALVYLRLKDHENALKIVETVTVKEPKNVHALVIFGRLNQAKKQIGPAEEAYEKVISLDSKQKDVYLLLGGLYMQENKLDDALRVYQQLVRNFPGSYAGHFFIGKIYVAKGDLKKAEKEFRHTIELNSDLEEPRFELLDLYKTMGKDKEFIRLYQEILEIDPQNIRAAMELGYYYHQKKKVSQAEKIFKDLGVRSDTEKEVIRTVVQRYLEPKKYGATVIIVEGMLKGSPENSDLHYVAGVALDEKKDWEKAVAHFKKVAPDSTFFQEAVVRIAFLYQEQKKIEQAIDYIKSAIKMVPDNPDLLLYLGSLYEENEEFSKAENVLKQGLEMEPDNTRFYFRLGVVYDKWDRKADSINAMKTVIRLDPKDATALNYLGYTYADLGEKLDEAERLIKAALEEKPDDGYITDSLGWVYFKKGLFEKAVEYLEKAVSLVPDDPIILEHMGDAYLGIRHKEKALEFYKRSLLNKNKDKENIEKKIQELTGK